jgi:SOS-response transcriptional repressors (RecA-mediated autopeptidases)
MPASKLHASAHLEIYSAQTDTEMELPLLPGVSAGFPSPASDFVDIGIDLNRHLIKHPSATFFCRVKGLSMKDAGIDDGDLLIVDKSIEPADGKTAVCFVDGEFTLKRIKIEKDEVWLMPANENYKPIVVTKDNDLRIWGVVTHIIKSL